MPGWLRKLFRNEPVPLRGAPAVRREKTYSAQSGYVYQYFYEGYREGSRGEIEGHEYVFNVSSDRSSRFAVAVFLSRAALEPWQRANERELTETECYAIVKMSLFQAFDERPRLGAETVDVIVTEQDITAHVETLDL